MNGTRRASRQWADTVTEVLVSSGFIASTVFAMVFFYHWDWGVFEAVWGDDFAAVGGDEGIRKLDALLEANFDKRLEAVVGPMKDTQGKILNRIIAYNAERKSFEWHTDGKHPKKIGEMLRFNERTKGASMTGTKEDGAKLRDGALELEGRRSRCAPQPREPCSTTR